MCTTSSMFTGKPSVFRKNNNKYLYFQRYIFIESNQNLNWLKLFLNNPIIMPIKVSFRFPLWVGHLKKNPNILMKEAVVQFSGSSVVSLKTRNWLCIQYPCIYQHKCTSSNKIRIKMIEEKTMAYLLPTYDIDMTISLPLRVEWFGWVLYRELLQESSSLL